MDAGGTRRHWTEDDDLADEIELYGELVVAASESERDLTLPQIDKVLGVDQCSERDGNDPETGAEVTDAETPRQQHNDPGRSA